VTTLSTSQPVGIAETGEPGSKGLKGEALGFVSGIVIGVASTAPGYSLAVSLGLVVAVVGLQAPAIMLVAFLPMLFIAAAYYYMNRADPDCGTSFSWVTKAMGPHLGWITGWAIIVADIIVMASLADVASTYTFALFGIDPSGMTISIGDFTVVWPVLVGGILWIAVMTWICYVGIEISARTQVLLLGMELFTLALFSVIALARVYTGNAGEFAIQPSLDWINPFLINDPSALAAGILIAIFIYWGWDSTVTVNEESQDATEGPGKAAVLSTVILVLTYLIVSIAAQAYNGAQFLADQADSDIFAVLGTAVMGSPLDKLLIIAVLTSASASTQTTILPTSRTALSMAAKGALPKYWGRVSARYLTPSTATVWMGIISIAWYVGLKLISDNVLADATAALGLMIAFYYGLTGVASPIYYRRHLRSLKALLFIAVLPLIGALVLFWTGIRTFIDDADPANTYTGAGIMGIGLPDFVVIMFMILGIVLLVAQQIREPAFFRRRPEVVDPHIALHGAMAPKGGE
jgi:amino acid transporter